MKMKIESLCLQNFRCFEDIQIDFDPQLTVLVGVNGAGKTAILDALALPLKDTMQAMRDSHVDYKRRISLLVSDLFKRAAEEKIIYKFKMYKQIHKPYMLEFSKTSKSSDTMELYQNINRDNRRWGDIITAMTSLSSRIYHGNTQPVFIYYQSKRNINQKIQESPEGDAAHLKYKAFSNAFSPNIDFSSSMSWFISKSTEEALEGKYKNDYSYEIPEVSAVRKAITNALGEYTTPRIANTPPELFVTRKESGVEYTINQLSDGYRAMLALIIDLARRMAVLNEKSPLYGREKILESPAIVLLDEVELHLHPAWQQTVLPTLMDIFPNTQFIVTTHSPQIISSIEPKHIRLLKDGKVLPVETSTYGAESSRILEEVFGVPMRPNNEAKAVLDEYLKLINDGQGNTENAKALRAKLDNWLAEDPILDKADMFIVRNARRKEREDNSRA